MQNLGSMPQVPLCLFSSRRGGKHLVELRDAARVHKAFGVVFGGIVVDHDAPAGAVDHLDLATGGIDHHADVAHRPGGRGSA